MIRRCASAVVCSRSMASVAKADGSVETEAARRPDDIVVDRLGHADERNALLVELVGDGECAVAADADQRIELHLLEHLQHTIAVVVGAGWRDNRLDERIAVIDGAENGAAETKDAGDVARCERSRFLRVNQPVEAVFESDHFDAGVARRLDDGANDCVQARSITASGKDTDLLNFWHGNGDAARATSAARRHSSIAVRSLNERGNSPLCAFCRC